MYRRSEQMGIREIAEPDRTEALSLVLDVFMAFEAPDYGEEGIDTFKSICCCCLLYTSRCV